MPPSLVPTLPILTLQPALTEGLPWATPSASANASARPASALLASSFASPEVAAGRSTISVVPRRAQGLGAAGVAGDVPLGLRIPGPHVDRLDLLDPGHPRPEAQQVLLPLELDRGPGAGPGGLEAQLAVLDVEAVAVGAREPRDQVPVGLRALLEELVHHRGRLHLGREAALAGDLAHDVRGGHLLEGPHLAHALELVALVEGADHELDALLAELGLERDDVALEDRRLRARLHGARLDLDLGADRELAHQGVDAIARRVRDPDRRRVRQRERVADADLDEQVAHLGAQLGPADEDADAGDVLGAAGHQLSSLGRLSARPRRRWSGFSMPLASAIERQTVASPYAS